MTTPLKPEVIARSFLDACLAELEALKPGNVHRQGAGHGMTVDDFVASAEAAAPVMGRQGLAVGERIKLAVEATQRAVSQNTNLGIILLATPLANAANAPTIDYVWTTSPPPTLAPPTNLAATVISGTQIKLN